MFKALSHMLTCLLMFVSVLMISGLLCANHIYAQTTQPADQQGDIFDEALRNIVLVCKPTEEQYTQLKLLITKQRADLIRMRATWDKQREILITRFKQARANEDKPTMDDTLDQINLIRKEQRNLAVKDRADVLSILKRDQQILWVTHEILSLTQITRSRAGKPLLSDELMDELKHALITRMNMFSDPVLIKNRDLVLTEVPVWVQHKTRSNKPAEQASSP